MCMWLIYLYIYKCIEKFIVMADKGNRCILRHWDRNVSDRGDKTLLFIVLQVIRCFVFKKWQVTPSISQKLKIIVMQGGRYRLGQRVQQETSSWPERSLTWGQLLSVWRDGRSSRESSLWSTLQAGVIIILYCTPLRWFNRKLCSVCLCVPQDSTLSSWSYKWMNHSLRYSLSIDVLCKRVWSHLWGLSGKQPLSSTLRMKGRPSSDLLRNVRTGIMSSTIGTEVMVLRSQNCWRRYRTWWEETEEDIMR